LERKHDLKKINLRVIDVQPFHWDNLKREGLTITWASDIGFGEYVFYRQYDPDKYNAYIESRYSDEYENNNPWNANSEYMDREDDKEFGLELLRLWLEQVHVR